jgi:hypothetical protein
MHNGGSRDSLDHWHLYLHLYVHMVPVWATVIYSTRSSLIFMSFQCHWIKSSLCLYCAVFDCTGTPVDGTVPIRELCFSCKCRRFGCGFELGLRRFVKSLYAWSVQDLYLYLYRPLLCRRDSNDRFLDESRTSQY